MSQESILNHIELGKSEGFNIYLASMDGYITYVARTLDNTFMGYTIGQEVKIVNKKFFQTKYTYFLPSYRGKGHPTALYMFIVNKLNIPIVSDGDQSPDGRKLWVSIAKHTNRCSVYDSENDVIIPLSSVNQDELYSLDNKVGDRYHLVIEQVNEIKCSKPSKIIYENVLYTRDNTPFF